MCAEAHRPRRDARQGNCLIARKPWTMPDFAICPAICPSLAACGAPQNLCCPWEGCERRINFATASVLIGLAKPRALCCARNRRGRFRPLNWGEHGVSGGFAFIQGKRRRDLFGPDVKTTVTAEKTGWRCTRGLTLLTISARTPEKRPAGSLKSAQDTGMLPPC